MKPDASRSAVPLMAGPTCTDTRVSFGTSLMRTGISPDSTLPATPVPLTANEYGLVPSRLPYFSLVASGSSASAGSSSTSGTARFSSSGTSLGTNVSRPNLAGSNASRPPAVIGGASTSRYVVSNAIAAITTTTAAAPTRRGDKRRRDRADFTASALMRNLLTLRRQGQAAPSGRPSPSSARPPGARPRAALRAPRRQAPVGTCDSDGATRRAPPRRPTARLPFLPGGRRRARTSPPSRSPAQAGPTGRLAVASAPSPRWRRRPRRAPAVAWASRRPWHPGHPRPGRRPLPAQPAPDAAGGCRE